MENSNRDDVFIKMVLSAWETQNLRLDQLLESLTDEQLSRETAPGKNTGAVFTGPPGCHQ
jgi:hypothetical protein